MPSASLVLLAVLAASLSGCTDAGPWHGRDLERQDPAYVQGHLEAGWTVRVDYDLAASQEIWWDWFIEEQQVIDFAVYQHARTGVVRQVQTDAAEDEGTFRAPSSGWYSMVWDNIAAENLTIQVRLPPSSWGNRYGPGVDPMAEDPCPPGLAADCSGLGLPPGRAPWSRRP